MNSSSAVRYGVSRGAHSCSSSLPSTLREARVLVRSALAGA